MADERSSAGAFGEQSYKAILQVDAVCSICHMLTYSVQPSNGLMFVSPRARSPDGMTDIGVSCAVDSYISGDGTPFQCNANEVRGTWRRGTRRWDMWRLVRAYALRVPVRRMQRHTCPSSMQFKLLLGMGTCTAHTHKHRAVAAPRVLSMPVVRIMVPYIHACALPYTWGRAGIRLFVGQCT